MDVKKIILSTLILCIIFPKMMYASESIQQKIDEAKPGATIYIEPSHYNETLTIIKPLILIGKGKVIIENNTDNPAITIKGSDDVKLENIHIINKAKTVSVHAQNSSNISLKNLILENAFEGIRLFQVKEAILEKINISGQAGHFSTKSNGITLMDTENIVISKATIQKMLDGIYIERDKNSDIYNNTIFQSRYGIHLMFSNGATISDNYVSNNVTGIMHMMTSDTTITKNILNENIDYNGAGLVLFDGEKIAVQQNIFSENNIGVTFQNIKNTNFQQNEIVANQTGVQFIQYDSSNVFTNNNIYGNIVSAASDKHGATVQGNYWDEYSGFDFDGDNFGDTPFQYNNSFAKLMVEQKAFQFFFESPAVAALTQIEKKYPLTNKSNVRDEIPLMEFVASKKVGEFQTILFLIGILFFIGGLIGWRKMFGSKR